MLFYVGGLLRCLTTSPTISLPSLSHTSRGCTASPASWRSGQSTTGGFQPRRNYNDGTEVSLSLSSAFLPPLSKLVSLCRLSSSSSAPIHRSHLRVVWHRRLEGCEGTACRRFNVKMDLPAQGYLARQRDSSLGERKVGMVLGVVCLN